MSSGQLVELCELHHVERDLVEFRDRIPGRPFSVEIGRSLWEEIGSPGKITVVVHKSDS